MLKYTAEEALFPPIKLPPVDLPTEDGIPLESNWHRAQINLLAESVHSHWRNRSDYFAGGNMYIHYCVDQVQRGDDRGPDFFLAKDVDGERERDTWIVWMEHGRYPNIIVELSSQWTIDIDLGAKKELYEKTFGCIQNWLSADPLGFRCRRRISANTVIWSIISRR